MSESVLAETVFLEQTNKHQNVSEIRKAFSAAMWRG